MDLRLHAVLAVGLTIISFTSTSGGCLIANEIAWAIAEGGIEPAVTEQSHVIPRDTESFRHDRESRSENRHRP